MTIAAVAAWGLAMLGLGLTGSLGLACLFLALGGVADFVSMVFRNAILQSTAPDEMRGRMQGVFIVVVTGGGLAVVVAVVILATASPSSWRYRANS